VSDGWMSPEQRPPSPEDVAEHFPQIREAEPFTIPTSVTEDFVAVVPRLAGAPSP